ncbi:DMT family transporter [Candidatus Dependentiae bacterium]|nr:DMT family transporter [Candidatus Dependentiae bacterium]
MILVIILYAIFAAMTFINTSLMSSDPYPVIVGMFRSLGSGGIILIYMVLFGKQKIRDLRLSVEQWYWLVGYGILIHAFAMFGFSYGAMYASPITICFLYATAPFLTAMLLYFYSGTVLNKTKILGLLVGFIGLMPILLKTTSIHTELVISDKAWFGNLIILVTMILFCWGWILFNKLIHSCSHAVQVLNGIAMIIGGILSTGFVGFMYGNKIFEQSFSANFMQLLFFFIVFSLITYSLYAYLLQHFSPTFISFAGFLEPGFALIYGVLWFGYSIQITDILSFMILFVGLYIFYRQELAKII